MTTNIDERLEELVSEVATKAMIGMQLAMHDGSSKHHEKVLDEAKQALKTEIARAVEETEKAFGGCKKCYGKGYQSAIKSTVSRLGKHTKLEMVYCSCDRGLQLSELSKEVE